MERDEEELYRSILDFQLDQPGISLTFSRRLARENRWSRAFAQRVIHEYKRFIYLAMKAGHPVTPSDQVDQVWHLHLTYSHSYWKEFCEGVLGRPLHHGPTKGGPAEGDKFADWYGKTLASYQRVFGSPPPSDIWHEPSIRFGKDLEYQRINPTDYVVLSRPRLAASIRLLLIPVAMAIVGILLDHLIAPSLSGWSGALGFFAACIAFIAGVRLLSILGENGKNRFR